MFSLGVGSELLEGHVPSAESGDEPSSSSRWLNSEIERKEDQTLMQAWDAFGNYGMHLRLVVKHVARVALNLVQWKPINGNASLLVLQICGVFATPIKCLKINKHSRRLAISAGCVPCSNLKSVFVTYLSPCRDWQQPFSLNKRERARISIKERYIVNILSW